ncbi:MAG: YbaB/EbfC family nucleoid-associated protein [Planctomycetota bacterium]
MRQGMDFGSLMKQAQKMQDEVKRVQKDLAERIVEGSAGGGAVKAMATGQQDLVSVKIDPSAVDPSDVGTLEDLVLAAVNNAIKESRELARREMEAVTGGLGIPGLM